MKKMGGYGRNSWVGFAGISITKDADRCHGLRFRFRLHLPAPVIIRGIGHSFILKERLQCHAADGGSFL